MTKSILLLEDDDDLRELIVDYFTSDGFLVTEAVDGKEALEYIDNSNFDLVLLDIMVPYIDGFTVCRRIRKQMDIPIIIITARDDEDDRLMGYELGADDYISKPFSPKVLLAKAKNLIKRADGTILNKEELIKSGKIEINISSHKAFIDGTKIELTPKEFELLVTLIENKDRVMSRDMLLSKIWGFDYYGDLRTVDTHIKKLRSKLGDKAAHITTVMKVGYKFEEDI